MGAFDGVFLLGYVAPASLAVFAALCKPQMCIAAGLDALRRRPAVAIAVGLVLVISAFAIWGWPFSVRDAVAEADAVRPLWNWSPWPWGLAFAPLLLRARRLDELLLLSPLVAPYASVYSWIGPLLVMSSGRLVLAMIVWLLFWLRWLVMLAG